MIRKVVIASVVLLSLLVIFPGAVFAQTLNAIGGTIRYADNSLADDVRIRLTDANGNKFESKTNNLGVYAITGSLSFGNYTVELLPEMSIDASRGSEHKNSSTSNVSIQSTDSGYNSSTGIYDLGSSTLQSYSRFVRVTVTSSGGSVVPLVKVVFRRSNTSDPRQLEGRTNSDGLVFFGLDSGDSGTYSVSGGGGVVQGFNTEVSVNSTDTLTDVAITVQPATASILVQLKDLSTSGTYTVPTPSNSNGPAGGIRCSVRGNGQFSFFKELSAGDTQATIPVVPNFTYECEALIPDVGSRRASVAAVDNQTVSVDVSVISKNATIQIRIVDSSTSEVVSGIKVDYSIFTTLSNDTSGMVQDQNHTSNDTGTASLPAVDNQEYSVSVSIVPAGRGGPGRNGGGGGQAGIPGGGNSGGGDSPPPPGGGGGGGNGPPGPLVGSLFGMATVEASSTTVVYLIPNPFKRVVAAAGTTTTVDIPVVKADSTIEVTATDTTGAPIEGTVQVNGGDFNLDSSGNKKLFLGTPLQNGRATISVVNGRDVELEIYPKFGRSSTQVLRASPQTVSALSSGETRSVEFRLLRANHSLTVQTTIPISEATERGVDLLHCVGLNRGGLESSAEIGDGNRNVTLPLYVDSNLDPWTISCYRVAGPKGSEKFYRGEALYYPSNTSSGTLSLTLTEFFSFLQETEYSFDASQSNTFILSDGSEISVPAEAVGSSGTAVMTVSGATGFSFNKREFPAAVLEISFTLDGASVSELEKPVEICIPVDTSLVSQVSGQSSLIRAGHFDTDTLGWDEDAGYEWDETTSTLCFSASEFSAWGALTERSELLTDTVPASPTCTVSSCSDLNCTVALSWTAPNSADSNTVYQLDVIASAALEEEEEEEEAEDPRITKCKTKFAGKKKKKKRKKCLRKARRKIRKEARQSQNSSTLLIGEATDEEWAGATTFSTSEVSYSHTAAKGSLEFRVRMQDGENSNSATCTLE